MSGYPGTGLPEPKKPGFLHRPVPMWAFLLLVVIIGIVIFLPAFLPSSFVAIKQPLVLTPDSRTLSIRPNEILTANFTVANLNATSTISSSTILTLSPPNSNITLTVLGVQTGTSFVASTDGKNVSFPPGGNTLVIRASSTMIIAGNYTIVVALTG